MSFSEQPTSSVEKIVPLRTAEVSRACRSVIVPAFVVILAGRFIGAATKDTMMLPSLLGRQDLIVPKAASDFLRARGASSTPSEASATKTKQRASIAPNVNTLTQVGMRRLGSKSTFEAGTGGLELGLLTRCNAWVYTHEPQQFWVAGMFDYHKKTDFV